MVVHDRESPTARADKACNLSHRKVRVLIPPLPFVAGIPFCQAAIRVEKQIDIQGQVEAGEVAPWIAAARSTERCGRCD